MASDASDQEDALKCFGLILENPAPAAKPHQPANFEVYPAHVKAFRLFMACLPQIPCALGGMGGARWSPVQAVNLRLEMRWLGICKKRQAKVVQQYRLIEAEALRILNERAASQSRR